MGFLNIVLSPIESIFEPIVMIGKAVVSIILVLVALIKKLPKILEIFDYVINPMKMFEDVLYGFKISFKLLWDHTFGLLFGKMGSVNKESYTIPDNLLYVCMFISPPFYIYLKTGIYGIIHILISGVLTYFYYFPGLVYSILYNIIV